MVAVALIAGDALRGENQRSVARKQATARCCFQFLPDLVRALHQGYELAAFANRLAGDAGVTVRRSLIVRRAEAVNTNAASAEPGNLIQRCAAHRPGGSR